MKALIKETTKIKINECIIVAPHPDDETFGCGGLINYLIKRKCKISIIFLTNGGKSLSEYAEKEISFNRVNLSNHIVELLGVNLENVFRLHLMDGELPGEQDRNFESISNELARLINIIKPDLIVTSHFLDGWPTDHVSAFKLTRNAILKSNHKPHLWLCWIWIWFNIKLWQLHRIDLKNTIRLNISQEFDLKQRAISKYLNTLAQNGKPWIGILPKALLSSFNLKFEMFTEYKYEQLNI